MNPRLIAKLIKSNRSDQECQICYRKPYENIDDLDGDDHTIVFKSICQHSFCFECLIKFDDSRRRFEDQPCPCCRDDISAMVVWLIYDEIRYIRKLIYIVSNPIESTDIKILRHVSEWYYIKNNKRAKKKTLYTELAKLII